MANLEFNFDTSDFDRKSRRFKQAGLEAGVRALAKIADEILRLSEREVPHDTGALQNSSSRERVGDTVLVGYNKRYAARLHEHPEFRFRKGRKGKYLEDPIKNNTAAFQRIFGQAIQEGLRG